MIGRLRFIPGLLVAGLLAAGLLWGTFNAWFAFDGNHRHVLSPYRVPVESWKVVEGEGVVRESELHLKVPGTMGYVLVAGTLPDQVESDWLDSINVQFAELGSYHEVQVGVSVSASLTGLREASLQLNDEFEGWVDAGDLFLEDGHIEFITLRVRGGLSPATIVERVELQRAMPGFVELQGLLLRSLVDLDGWTQRSINHNRPDYVPLRVSPVVAVFLWVGLFVLMAMLLLDRASVPRRRGMMMIGLGLFVGWVLLDVAWQVSLWARHADTVSKYTGVSADRKSINDLDAEVSAFVHELRERIDDDTRPMVIFSENVFTYFRARYAAAPHPVVGSLQLDARWMRRIRPRDLLVTFDLSDPLNERLVSKDSSQTGSEQRDLPLESVAGRHAELVDCTDLDMDCVNSILRLKEGQRPWLVEIPWMDDLGDGVWQLELDLTGGHRMGWVRLEVFRRSMGNSKRWAWREIYLGEGQSRVISLAFRANKGAEYRMQLRGLNAEGVTVEDARLIRRAIQNDLIELSLNKGPPYFLARRVLESEGKSAWEML